MILVVDDNADSSRALVQLLRRYGYEASSRANGAEALLFLDDKIPDLVILDFNMPELNGHDVLRAIRANARLHEIPVLIYTADSSAQRHEESLRFGAQKHLVKGSLDWMRLIAEINRLARTPR